MKKGCSISAIRPDGHHPLQGGGSHSPGSIGRPRRTLSGTGPAAHALGRGSESTSPADSSGSPADSSGCAAAGSAQAAGRYVWVF